MQLYILDKDPVLAAIKVPDKYKFKMLIELAQLICSTGMSDVYKKIPQGKELQQWVWDNKCWTYLYFMELARLSWIHTKISATTIEKLQRIADDIAIKGKIYRHNYMIKDGYFRYKKEYKCEIPSGTLLPVDECISRYEKYLVNFKNARIGE